MLPRGNTVGGAADERAPHILGPRCDAGAPHGEVVRAAMSSLSAGDRPPGPQGRPRVHPDQPLPPRRARNPADNAGVPGMQPRDSSGAVGRYGSWGTVVQVIGPRAAARLTQRFPGAILRIPLGTRQRLRAQISDELDCQCAHPRHHTYRAIAKRHGVSVACVARIAKQPNHRGSTDL